jgi:uncharacterized LabA/DUF88 family protein
MENEKKITNVYIDASNLFYGGRKSLGWSVDFGLLVKYLKDRFEATDIYYFGGIEIFNFEFDYLVSDSVNLNDLENYFLNFISDYGQKLTIVKLETLDRNIKQVRFYQKLHEFGFKMILKPVKVFRGEDGVEIRKANCDVEMAMHLMRDKDTFERVVFLSGDGDFLPVLKYLRNVADKEVIVLSRAERTAKEIKRFAGDKFINLASNNMKEKFGRDIKQ